MKITESDRKMLSAARITVDDCPKCEASQDMQHFYGLQHDRLVATITHQASQIIRDTEAHRVSLHTARLVAFAGWFFAALLIGIQLVYRIWPG